MKVYVGTSGYSYKEWKGTFYPESLKNDDMLRYYGTKLNSVEINSSFYRMPRSTTLQEWRDAVPDGFRFTLKASKRITHEKMLKDASDSVDYLFGLTDELGDKLGPVLFQLHPRLRCDVELFRAFLASLPKDKKVCFELQHPSWTEHAEQIDQLLAERDAARVYVHEDGDPPGPPPSLPRTASWGYVRLRACDYADADLAAWRDAFVASGWTEAYAYFKHEEAMSGPEYAVRFLHLPFDRDRALA